MKKLTFCLATLLTLLSPGADTLERQSLPLTFGLSAAGTIGTPAEQDRFTFNGALGQRLVFDPFLLAPDLYVQITSPAGTIVFSATSGADYPPFYLTEAGEFTLTVDGSSEATGEYRFRVLDSSAATVLPLGTAVNGQLNPSSESDLFRFDATAGELFRFQTLSPSTLDGAVWTLYDTGNQRIATQGMGFDLGEIFIPVTGSYVLVIAGLADGNAPVDYSFRVTRLSSPTGTATGFGVQRTGTVDASTTATFTYQAPAGTVIYFDALENDFDPAKVEFKDPDGTVMFTQNPSSDSGPLVLPKSGAYQVVVSSADGSSAADYDFQILNLSSAPLILPGTQQTATLKGFEARFFPVTATPGRIILYDATAPDSDQVHSTILNPRLIAFGGSGNAEADSGPILVLEPGRHLVLVQNNLETEADVAFRLLDASQPPSVALSLNTTVTGTLPGGRETLIYTFQATSGQRIFFDALTESASAIFSLYSPNLTFLGGWNLAQDVEVGASQTGTYLLVISGTADEPVPYSFRVVSAVTSTAALNIGAVTTGTLTGPGEEHRFTFNAAAGERFLYDALDEDFDGINVRLVDPLNQVVIVNSNADSDSAPFTLQVPGTYTLVIGGNTSTLGDYKFRLVNLAQPPAIPLALGATISRTLNPPIQSDIFTFEANAGQHLFFDALASPSSGSWVVYSPNNTQLVGLGQSLGSDYYISLSQSGQYVLVVSANGIDPIPYSFRVLAPPTPVQAYTLGSTISGNLTQAGEQHRFTFNATIGQRLIYDGLDTDDDAIHVQLLTPAGYIPIQANSDSDWGPYLVAETGTHTLLIGGLSETLGDYKFRLLDLANAAPITADQSVNVTLDPGRSVAIYSFQSPGGEIYEVETTQSSSTAAIFTGYGPAGNTIGAGPLGTTFQLSVESPGKQFIVLSGSDESPLTASFVLRRLSGGEPNTFGQLYEGSLGAEEVRTINFTARVGTLWYLDWRISSSPVTVEILNPGGDSLGTWGASDFGPHLFPSTGQYTLKIIGNSGGDYSFALIDLSASPVLTSGTALTGQIPPLTVLPYRFDAKKEEIGIYDSLLSINQALDVALSGPGGFSSGFFGSAHNDFFVGDFPVDGTYFLLLRNNSSEPNDYAFRLLLSSAASTQPIAFDTTVGEPLTAVPAGSLTVTGSYINGSLRSNPEKEDWRQTQTIVGTRNDPTINFLDGAWGSLTSVGLVPNESGGQNGSDQNWENFSVQWDGTVSITRAGTRLYTRSDDGSRLWIDVNKDGTLGTEAPEFTDVNWGFGGGATLSPGSAALPVGTYPLRVQYEQGCCLISMELLMDGAIALGAREAVLYRFEATAGQRLVFDSLEPSASGGSWILYFENGSYGSGSLAGDTEIAPLPYTGTYVIHVGNHTDQPIPFGFRLITPETTSLPFSLGVDVTGTLPEPDSRHEFTFTGQAGQLFYYDAQQTDFEQVAMLLLAPDGGTILHQNADYDVLFRLPLSGTYRLVMDENSLSGGRTYRFRLLDVATTAQAVAFDQTVSGTLLNARAALFTVNTPDQLRLVFDMLDSDPDSELLVYNSANTLVGNSVPPNDAELLSARAEQLIAVVNSRDPVNPVDYSFRIIPGNHPPAFSAIGNRSVDEQTTFTLTPQNQDPERDNDTIQYSLGAGAPAALSINPNSGALSWTTTETDGRSEHTITVIARDDGLPSMSYSETFRLTVNEVNRPPVLNPIPDVTVNEGSAVTFSATATDPDIPANSLQFSLDPGAPAGASVNAATGAFSWTPGEADGPGVYNITLRVTDSNPDAVNEKNLSATRTFKVTVGELNAAPVLGTIGNKSVDELAAIQFRLTATDSDLPANGLVFSAENLPAGATLNPSTGEFSWTPTEAQGPNGFLTITFKVTDTGSADPANPSFSDEEAVLLVVNEVNTPPVLAAIGNKTVDEQTELKFTASATDSDIPANALRFSLSGNIPAGAAIDENTGVFTWTPTEAQGPGTYPITVVVTDAGFDSPRTTLADSEQITITVREINRPPILDSIADRTVNELTAVTFTATGSDADLPANSLTFSLEPGAPADATINSATGAFAWTPGEAHPTGPTTITVRLSDGTASTTRSFTVTVNEVNAVPELAAIPDRTVNAGERIEFTATATDSDIPANTLTFSLVSPPAGATIDSSTGRFAWRPTLAQEGQIFDLTVRVTDNGTPVQSASRQFRITVRDLLEARISQPGFVPGQEAFQFQISGPIGPDYTIQSSTDLQEWTTVQSTTPTASPFTVTDSSARKIGVKFYRILLGP